MTAPSSTKLQVNFKTSGGTLINAYADHPDELVNELTALESLAGTIVAVEGLLNAASAAGNVAAPPSQTAPNPHSAPAQALGQWQQPQAPQPTPDAWAQQAQQGPPPAWAGQQAAPAAPAAPAGKACVHGPMTFKQGVSKSTGKPWSAWFCPTPKGTPGQCEAEFVR